MKFLLLLLAIYQKIVLKKSNGYVVKHFAQRAGTVYIKLAQMLAMQNIDNLFTEDDRQDLLHICDDVNPVPYRVIRKTLKDNYGVLSHTFKSISKKQLGSASISQVHRAVLTDGTEVVVKVKRKDIEASIEKDMKFVYFVVKYFGWIISMSNLSGTRKGLDFYMTWLKQEIDFNHEVTNIERYREFAVSVRGKVAGTTNIVVPKVYKEYCTSDVIVMEYIPYPTISNGHYTQKQQLAAISSYLKLSFYALLHGMPVVFHGDPHAGNIYIDENNNIGFLDMGLIFELTAEDARTTMRYFFGAYFQRYNYLYKMLEPFMDGPEEERRRFKNTLRKYCDNIPNRPVTMYFMDLCVVCFSCSICPQDFLFGMAKAFVCISGFDNFLHNEVTGHELLGSQVEEYLQDVTIPRLDKIVDLHKGGLTGLLRRIADISDVIDFVFNK